VFTLLVTLHGEKALHPMIKKSSVDRVIDTARIEEVVEDFVRLKRRGSGFQGLCPFHNEKTPSFRVNPAGNFYKCFGCGKGGNSVNFIMEHEKMNFPEAIKYLAGKYNIPLEEEQVSDEQKVEVEKRENILSLLQYAAKYYDGELFESTDGQSIGMPYFKERGYLESTIKTFGLGFASTDRSKFTRQALKDGFDQEMLQECGLSTQSGNDFFYNRVMFTIHDISGRPVAFAGRIMGKQANAPKYINSPETEVYKKSFVLYGLYQARQALRKEDNCIIVEGYTDVLSLYQAGIHNVVASSGTALTEGQLRLIRRFTQNVTMLYDGDTAGINAATRAIDLVHEQDMQVQLVLLPGGNDPDSFVKELGAEGFQEHLTHHAMDFIAFRKYIFDQSGGEDPIAKTNIIREIVTSISKIPDAIKRSLYLRICSTTFEMEESILVGELNSILRKEIYRQRKKENAELTKEEQWVKKDKKESQAAASSQFDFFQERELLRILISYGDQLIDEDENIDLATFILANLEDMLDEMKNEESKKIISVAKKTLEKGQIVNEKLFTHHEDSSIQTLALEIIAKPYEYSENWTNRWGLELQTQLTPDKNFLKDATQAILRYKERKIKTQQQEFIQQIIDAEKSGNEDEALRLTKMYLKLKQDHLEIAQQLNSVIIP